MGIGKNKILILTRDEIFWKIKRRTQNINNNTQRFVEEIFVASTIVMLVFYQKSFRLPGTTWTHGVTRIRTWPKHSGTKQHLYSVASPTFFSFCGKHCKMCLPQKEICCCCCCSEYLFISGLNRIAERSFLFLEEQINVSPNRTAHQHLNTQYYGGHLYGDSGEIFIAITSNIENSRQESFVCL